MNINPSANTCLYGMNKFFNDIKELYDKKKMPNKILLSGKKGLGKSTLAYHIINYILSIDEEHKYDEENFNINKNNRSFKLLQNQTHPNFYLIDLVDEKKNIDVGQVREMITYTNKSSFNNMPRFILIDNIENLNKNSVNALLKIVEEPSNNIYFILIHNIEKKILPTLKSRCLQFKINFSLNESIDISNRIIGENIHNLINFDLISHYNTPGDITNLINFSNEKKINIKEHSLTELLSIMIDNSYYKKNKILKSLIINLIELYFLKEYKATTSKTSLLNIYYNFINKINNNEIYNLDDESLFLEFKTRLLNE
jgi:DNA polymerase-3 subunit delta'